VRVNCVSPGPVETPLWHGADGVAATVGASLGLDPATVAATAAADAVTGRVTLPSEVADLVLYLASKRSGNVTGADFLIDGGMTDVL
jgi:NAD(P)-dependent dehydrogenase (short-subunit alcohol dehydrogenase family)